MEIDFLGLNSTTKFDNMNNSKDAIFPTDTGWVETTLSLSTATRPPLYCHKEVFSEEKRMKKWAELYSRSGTDLVYNPNQKMSELRNMSDIPVEPMLYSAASANVLIQNLPGMAENILSHRTTNGYTPTVAMARRATLARFLEKRLHRVNQARTAHLMGPTSFKDNDDVGGLQQEGKL